MCRSSRQLLYISHFWYGGQLLPPVGCVQLAGLPFQPQFIVLYGWLHWVTLPTPGANHGHLQEMLQLWPQGAEGLGHLSSGQVLLGFSLGPLIRGCPFLRFAKGYASLWPMPVWRPNMPLQRSTPRAAAAVGALAFHTICFF